MKRTWLLVPLAILLLAGTAPAQGPAGPQAMAALKQSLAENQQKLHQYQWIETTIVTVKGRERSRSQKMCYYGADGKVQKVALQGGAQPQQRRGLLGRVEKRKKAKITDAAEQAQALVKQYLPPDAGRLEAAHTQGKMQVSQADRGLALIVNGYQKPNDRLEIDVNLQSKRVLGLSVNSYLDNPDDRVSLQVTMGTLPDGTNYPADSMLRVDSQSVQVEVQNSGYRQH